MKSGRRNDRRGSGVRVGGCWFCWRFIRMPCGWRNGACLRDLLSNGSRLGRVRCLGRRFDTGTPESSGGMGGSSIVAVAGCSPAPARIAWEHN